MTAATKSYTAPLIAPPMKVIEEWIDYNGHMNMAFYNTVFDKAVDALFIDVGISEDYVTKELASVFTAEIHVTYAQELSLHDPIKVTCQLLDFDAKRIHMFLEMYHAKEGYLAATMEQIGIHVSMESRRSAVMPDWVLAELQALKEAHKDLPIKPQVGRVIGIPKKSAGATSA